VTESGVRMIETPGGRVFVSDADQGSVAREPAPIDAATIEERAAALGTWSSFNLRWV
jgi:hypothetical protein